ncbi:MAG: hypothetical protein J6R85_02050 [Lentisphaeria bacterium]|nr:hypothetical protein [Lentisphaeria bacterium]
MQPLRYAAAQLRLPEGDLATGEFHAGGKFSGSWRNGSWQIQGRECTGQWGDTACLAPEITLETAPGMKLRRAGFPRLTLTFEGGNCDLAGVEFSPGSLRCDAVSGDWLGWKFQASGVRLTPELLQWSNGTCTGHGIALRGVQLDTAAGTFSAQSAKPGTWMDSFSAKTTLQKGTLTFRGKGISGLLQNGGFFFHGSAMLSDPAKTIRGEFTLPAISLRNPLPLKKLAPAGGDWTLAGKLACTGTFSVAEGVPRWNPAWSFEGSAASAEGSAEQLLLQLTPQGILEGVAGSFRSGRFQGSDGEIAVDLSGKTPRLQRASFSLWSGNWQWDPAAKCFHFRNLSPESILPLQQWQNAISGNFRGEGIFRWEKGMQLQKLEAFSERSARWKLGEMEPLRYVPAKGVDPELFGFAAALARDFLARRTALTVEVLPAGTLVQIRGEGKPAAPVPYVYDGKAIRPALPEDHGFSTAVELDCDYWIPVKP